MSLFTGNLRSKLPKVGTSIFSVMTQLANEENALNLSQGFPDFNPPDNLLNLVNQHMQLGHNQYAPLQGILPLRESIAEKMESLYSAKYDPDKEINITSGATQAIYTAISAFVNEGDEVLVFQPAYDCYVPAIEMNGGIPVYVDLIEPEYSINWEEVQKKVNSKTRMILINTPHNPTGSIMTAGDMAKLEKLTDGSNIIILSDEVYEHILFDGYEHQSIARFPKLVERSLVIFSFGKTYHNTGWKMGYCLAPENLMEEFRKVHQFTVFSSNTPIQYALAEYMKDKSAYLELNNFFQEKRDLFIEGVKGSKFTCEPSSGTYFQLLSYKNISEEKDTEFAIKLTKENGIASIPVSVFYNKPVDNHVLRFCFAKDEKTIEKACELLHKV